jgi:hypothetical protein
MVHLDHQTAPRLPHSGQGRAPVPATGASRSQSVRLQSRQSKLSAQTVSIGDVHGKHFLELLQHQRRLGSVEAIAL